MDGKIPVRPYFYICFIFTAKRKRDGKFRKRDGIRDGSDREWDGIRERCIPPILTGSRFRPGQTHVHPIFYLYGMTQITWPISTSPSLTRTSPLHDPHLLKFCNLPNPQAQSIPQGHGLTTHTRRAYIRRLDALLLPPRVAAAWSRLVCCLHY